MALLRYVSVIYNFVLDVFLFDESFTQLQLIGAGTVLFTNVLVVLVRAIRDRQASYAPMKDPPSSIEL